MILASVKGVTGLHVIRHKVLQEVPPVTRSRLILEVYKTPMWPSSSRHLVMINKAHSLMSGTRSVGRLGIRRSSPSFEAKALSPGPDAPMR